MFPSSHLTFQSIRSRGAGRALYLILFIPLLHSGCKDVVDIHNEEMAREHSQMIMDSLHSGHIEEYFTGKYFKGFDIKTLMENLARNCSPESRKGTFLNRFYMKNLTGPDAVAFNYRYEYDCHVFVFKLSYLLSDTGFEFVGFHIGDESAPP
jgi:hypothetical protein